MKIHSLNTTHWPKAVSEVQTRSETTGLIQHPTLMQALRHADSDDTVWKISYSAEQNKYYRFVRTEGQKNLWQHAPIGSV